MTKKLKLIPRYQLDTTAWDACVATSPQRILYGSSWYLDIVLPAPDWKWLGLIQMDEAGAYQAVMPVPLRRKTVAGITYEWVVHQPFFCQFLDVFSHSEPVDPTPFFRVLGQQFRYGSALSVRQQPSDSVPFDIMQVQTTHVLDLSVGYKTIYQHYTPDRKANLRRVERARWSVDDSIDLEPLLRLFQENHAASIGVADWAYDIIRNLFYELSKRKLVILRYASRGNRIEAGALFVREGNRIIYLFNAASESGRRGNARTLLIDQIIQEYASKPLIFDFESPEKPSIRDFYRSFGSVEEPFWCMRWNRLNNVERLILRFKNRVLTGN